MEVISLSHVYLGLLAVAQVEIQTKEQLSYWRLSWVTDFRGLECLVWIGEVTLQRTSLADVGHIRGAHMFIVLSARPPYRWRCLQELIGVLLVLAELGQELFPSAYIFILHWQLHLLLFNTLRMLTHSSFSIFILVITHQLFQTSHNLLSYVPFETVGSHEVLG